jgi:hypothetical protein
MSVTDEMSAASALKAAQSHVAEGAVMLGILNFTDAPWWLAASFRSDDKTRMDAAFSRAVTTGAADVAVRFAAEDFSGRFHLAPDRDSLEAWWGSCYRYSAIFTRGPFRHRTDSRICQDPVSGRWTAPDALPRKRAKEPR